LINVLDGVEHGISVGSFEHHHANGMKLDAIKIALNGFDLFGFVMQGAQKRFNHKWSIVWITVTA
jgi:hypothetical protein